MTIESAVVILGMGIATYLTRILGFYMASKMTLTPKFKAALTALPVALIISIIGPEVIKGGLPEWTAGIVVLVLARKTGNLLFCLVVGILVVVGMRALLG